MKKIVMTLLAGLALNAMPAYADVTLEMVRIPAGSFVMGCQVGRDKECEGGRLNMNNKPTRKVNLLPFEIGKYEVTQGQWKSVMGDNPSDFKDCGDNCPVENISWDDIHVFIQKLNVQTGKT